MAVEVLVQALGREGLVRRAVPPAEPVGVQRIASRQCRVVRTQTQERATVRLGNRVAHIYRDFRQSHRMGTRAAATGAVSHVALVIRTVEVHAVPTLREDHDERKRIADRAARNSRALPAEPAGALDPDLEAAKRIGVHAVARDHPQPLGERLNVGAFHPQVALLVVEKAACGRQRLAGANVDQRRHPVRSAVQRTADAGGIAGVHQAVAGTRCVGVRVAEERVQVRCVRHVGERDRIVEPHVREVARFAKRTDIGGCRLVVGERQLARAELASAWAVEPNRRLRHERRIRDGAGACLNNTGHGQLDFAVLAGAIRRIGAEVIVRTASRAGHLFGHPPDICAVSHTLDAGRRERFPLLTQTNPA